MADLTIKALIEVLLKGGNVPAALRADLEKLRGQAEKTATGVGSVQKSLDGLKRSITNFIGGAALARFAQASLTEFAKLERGFGSLGIQMEQLGISSKEALPQVKETLHAIQAGGGALQTETLPIMQRFIGVTKDVNEALFLTKLAADAGESGFIETGQAADAFANILQGRARGAAQALGIEFFKLNGAAKSNGELMAEAIAKFQGLGDKMDDAQNNLERFASTWSDIKVKVGAGIAILSGPAAKAFDVLTKSIQTAGVIMGTNIDMMIQGFQNLGRVLSAALDLKSLVTSPTKYLSTLTSAVDTALRDIALSMQAGGEEFAAIWAKSGQAAAEAFVGPSFEQFKLIEQANRAAAAAELQTALETAAKVAKARVDAAKKGSDEELAARLALIDAQYAADIQTAKTAGDTIAGMEEARLAERAAVTRAFNEARVEAETASAQKLAEVRADNARKGSQEELDLRLDAINKSYAAEIAKSNQSAVVRKNLELARDAELAEAKETFAAEARERELSQAESLQQAKISLEEQALTQGRGLATENLDELARLQQELLDIQYQAAIEAAEKTGADVTAIQKTFDLLAAKSALEINQRKLDLKKRQEIEALQLDVEASQANSRDRYRADKKLLEKGFDDRIATARAAGQDTVKLEEAKEEGIRSLQADTIATQVNLYGAAASQIVGMAQQAFGEHKAFAIAGAIISTAQAVANAYADLPAPANVAFAAVIAALGAIQIAKIASTNPGSSGAPSAGGGASVSATSGSSGRRRRTEGERPPRQEASRDRDRTAASTGVPAARAVSRADEREGRRAQGTTIINNNNQQTTYAPSTNVTMQGVVATTRTQVMKDLHRGLDRVQRTVIRKGRING